MDRPPHEFGGPNMPQQQQQQQFGFHPQQQFPPPPMHGGPPPYLQPHPSTLQQFPYPRPIPQQPPPPQMYQHLPPHPHILQQQPPSFPPLPVPSPYHYPYEATPLPPPPPTPPPSDPELQKRIDKLVEYAIKNGPEFEAVVREREQDNPAYGFLFGGEGNGYYRYKLWMSTRPPVGGGSPFNPGFPPLMHPPNPMMSPGQSGVLPPPPPIMGSSLMQQQPPPFYDQQLPHHGQPMVGHSYGRPGDFDNSPRPPPFEAVSRPPLPSDVEMELNGVLNSLTGTKESIKGAKAWFMQRSALIPALAEALRDRMFATENPERQLHIIYLANDILFDSLQRRVNPQELDNEALAFKPVLGSMLARAYHNPHHREDNQSRIKKIVQFWASKEVYDKDTIFNLENEMINGLPPATIRADASPLSGDPSSGLHKMGTQSSSQWQPENQALIPNIPNQIVQNPHVIPLPTPPFHQAPIPSVGFAPSVPIPSNLQQTPTTSKIGEKPPPYPLFPPGLIPGMVRKMQIGSGVPYSPLSPLDIPTTIPPSNIQQSEILDRVSKFFRDIGEVNPCEGPMKGSSASRDDYEDYEYEKEPQVRKGGACIPPPPSLNPDPETGTFPDGSVEHKTGAGSGSGRLGLGATADPNQPSQYDDVYSSYRKHRSTNYHTSMSSRAAAS